MKNLNKYLTNKINIGKNKYFTLIIGLAPSKGARSPILWNNAYKYLKKKTRMYPADVNEKNLGILCKYLRSNKFFLGSSVTVPYKEKIIQYLDSVDENAKSIGSINTIIKKRGKLFGLNTDYYGSIYTLKKINMNNQKKKILILGSGGAGKACIISVINFFKKSKIFIFNRSFKKLKNFTKKLISKNKNIIQPYSNISKLKKIKNINLILNCTSVGFDGWVNDKGYYNLKNYSPLSKIKLKKIKNKNYESFQKKNFNEINKNSIDTLTFLSKSKKVNIFDIIYQPLKTKLLFINELLGNKNINGLDMNFMQAVEAFKIVNNFNDKKKIMKGMRNGK